MEESLKVADNVAQDLNKRENETGSETGIVAESETGIVAGNETGLDFVDCMIRCMGIKEVDPKDLNPIVLAYVGDAVYSLAVRTFLVANTGKRQVNKINNDANSMVSAKAQAKSIDKIEDLLTEEEKRFYKRGMNAKTNTCAKNASLFEYRKATGLEALVGSLYLLKRYDRLMELIHLGLQ